VPQIRVSHNRSYKWEIAKRADVPPDEHTEVAAKEDEVLHRTVLDTPGATTDVYIPEDQITRERWQHTLAAVTPLEGLDWTNLEAVVADETRRTAIALQMQPAVTRTAVVAEWMQKVGLKHHVPPGAVDYFECPEEPALAGFLNELYAVKGSPAPQAAAAPEDVYVPVQHWKVPAEWAHQPGGAAEPQPATSVAVIGGEYPAPSAEGEQA
jgi:hypothetical protein